MYLLFLLVQISYSSKYQRRPLQEGELWQEISANVGEGTDPGIVGPDAHTGSERGHSHPLK